MGTKLNGEHITLYLGYTYIFEECMMADIGKNRSPIHLTVKYQSFSLHLIPAQT
jgi:hypothetical protein